MMTLSKYLSASEIKQTEAAAQLEVSQAEVSRWATGAKIPSLEMVLKIEEWSKGQVGPRCWLPADKAKIQSQLESVGAGAA